MSVRRLRSLLLVCLFALLPLGLVLTSLTAAAQGNSAPPTPTPAKNVTPAPTPKGQSPARPAIPPPVEFGFSTLSPRGAHSGEISVYTAVIVNSGSTTATNTTARLTIPSNTTYVGGSAAVLGGGILSVNASQLEWQGRVAPGGHVTISFQTTLPAPVGTLVTNSVTIFDPAFPNSLNIPSQLRIQANSLGPDAFGYTVKDSFAPGGPTFSWVPTTLTATRLFTNPPNDDQVTGPVSLNFNFLFYGSVYTRVAVNTNGLVMFGISDTANVNTHIPNIATPNNFAACQWDDLIANDLSESVWMQTFGNAPNRTAVITWRMADFGLPLDSAAHPFQMILFETTNRIKCQYADTSSITRGTGGYATVGLESGDGTAGLAYFTGETDDPGMAGPLENGLAVGFAPGPATLPVFSGSHKSASFTVHPGEVATFTVVMSNSGSANGAATSMNDPIPAGATYVPGSAAVKGGGTLTANASTVHWTGVVTKSEAVTVTYRVTNSLAVGTLISNVATISDPAAGIPILVNAGYTVLPPPAGGPDAFGYSYKDSYAPGGPVFNWVSPTLTATVLFTAGNDDVVTGPLPIGFSFNFYGGSHSQMFASTNGLVLFGAGDPANINEPIPNAAAPNNFAACMWSDLISHVNAENVWSQTFGSAPNRTRVITWRLTDFGLPDDTAPHLFQMILSETNNQIKCQYADMGDNNSGTGNISTVGLESPDGLAGLQYFFASDYFRRTYGPLENRLAILFFSDNTARPVFAASDKTVAGGGHPGEVVTYTLHLRNDGSLAAAAAHLADPIPAGATFVPGSAAASSGVVAGNSSAVTWNGAVAAGAVVTLTYRVTLTALSGVILNSGTISAPLMTSPQVVTAALPVQPYSGWGTGADPGYAYRDSFAPSGPVFSWVPTSALSTQLFPITSDDSISGPVPLGFQFQYFGKTYSNVIVSSNGLVMFNSAGSIEFENKPIPSLNSVSNFATCFWDDQTTIKGGGVWMDHFGVPGLRTAVVTFIEAIPGITTTPPLEYQMIFYEQGNRIECQYRRMHGTLTGDGRSATVGLQNNSGDSGIQYFYGNAETFPHGPLENNLAIMFEPLRKTYLPVIAR